VLLKGGRDASTIRVVEARRRPLAGGASRASPTQHHIAGDPLGPIETVTNAWRGAGEDEWWHTVRTRCGWWDIDPENHSVGMRVAVGNGSIGGRESSESGQLHEEGETARLACGRDRMR